MKRPDSTVGPESSGRALEGGTWGGKHPLLWEHLSSSAYEDGSGRRTSTLTVFCEDGLVKLCLNDRDVSRTAWASDQTLVDAFCALEESLRSETIQWRKVPPAPQKRGKGA